MLFASFCRVCLSSNKRTKIIANTELQTVFENLTSNPLISGDGRPERVCYLCHRLLQRCCKFVDLSRKSEQCLSELLPSGVDLKRHTLTIKCPSIQNNSQTLSVSKTTVVSITKLEEGEYAEVYIKRIASGPSIDVYVRDDTDSENTLKVEFEQTSAVELDTNDLTNHKSTEKQFDESDEKSPSDDEDSDSTYYVPSPVHRQDTPPPTNLGNSSETKIKQDLFSSEYSSVLSPKQIIDYKKPFKDSNVKKNASLTKDNRARIISLSKQGCSIHEISRKLKVTRNTVKRWIKRNGEEGFLKDRRQHNKGSRRITDEQVIEMQRHIEKHPFTPLQYFAARYDACIRTIRKCLYSAGLHHRLCKKVPLTDSQRLERLNFARGYLDFDWTNVIFSGEKSFSSQRNRLTLKRYSITQDNEEQSSQSTGSNTTSMWGWMSAAGVGELVNISLETASNYVELLEETMLPTVRTVYPVEDVSYILYVHDNSPEHSAIAVSEWFYQHPDIYVIPWPSKSQDLNPIENLWGLMIEMWDKRGQRSGQEIEQHCNEIWEFVRGSEICSRLVGSMRTRLLEVIESNGA